MSTLSKVITNYPYAWSLEKRKHFVDLLLELGADPNLETSGVDSSLMHAVRFGDPVLVKTLLVANVDPCHTGNNGCTVLHVFFLTYRSTGTVLIVGYAELNHLKMHISKIIYKYDSIKEFLV